MESRAVHLLATERHVDAALLEGRSATTWRAFLRRITASSRGATPEMTHLATSLALDSLQEELQWASGHAVVGTLDDALGVLRRAGTDFAALRRTRHVRCDVLASFLERTDTLLDRAGVFDDRAIGWVAAERIGVLPQDELPGAVVIDGLFEWDASTFAWVEALARRVPVTVRMPRFAGPAGEKSDLGRSPDALLSELEGRWQELPDAPELDLFDVAFPPSVSLIEGATGAAEARTIAHVVREALAAGTSAEEIAIVLPSLDEGFLEPLRAAFGEARIAFAEPRGRPPIAAPAVRVALGWLDLSVTLHRDGLIDLLRSNAVDPAPFIEAKTLELRRRRALALASRLARVPVGTDHDRTLLLQVLSAEIDPRSEDSWMIEALERILSALGDLAEPMRRAAFVQKLVGAWESMRLGEAAARALAAFLASETSSRQAEVLSGLVREEAVGLGALVDAAHRAESAATALGEADSVVSSRRFRGELEAALTGGAPRGTRRAGAVRIVRVSDVSRLSSDLLIVARASEGAFEPSRASPILAEEVVATLPPARRPVPLRLLAAAARAELLCAISATRRLVLTRSLVDADGRPCASAPLFSELRVDHPVRSEPASALSPASSVLSARAAELIALGSGAEVGDPDVGRRVAIERERLAFFFDPRRPAGPVTGQIATVDQVADDRLREAFGGTKIKPIAATAIERAALCRFAAFATRVLGASTSDTVGEGLEPWQRGSLIHRALQAAFEAARPRWSVATRAEIEAVAADAARKAVLGEQSSPLFRAEVERALRDVAAVVGWSLDDPSDFVFAHGERSFGATPERSRRAGARSDEPWPALAIGEGNSTIFVGGRIDRIDTSRDGSRVRVIDYKTGTLPAWKDVGTRLFQPPLYAYAVLRQMGRLSLIEQRALYLDTSKRPPKMLPAEDKQIMTTEKIAEAQGRAAALVSKLWRGDVPPRPADALVCGRCDVRDICRRPAAMPVEDLEQEGDGSSA
jgi:ATP-dependent helicase/nuclease subunit B